MARASNVIRSIRIEADSACRAWYQLRLVQIREGYLIYKSSGAAGQAKPSEEQYYRENLREAEEKFFSILNAKLKQQGPRKYRRVSAYIEPPQLELFAQQK